MISSRLNLLLIYPPNSGARQGIKGIYYPLGIGYIASVLRKYFKVKVHDFNYDFCLGYFNSSNYVENILKQYDYDFLLIGGVFPRFKYLKQIIEVSKKISKAKIIIGGSYLKPSIKVLANYLKADYYVLGEGEEIVLNLLKHIVENRSITDVDGIAYHSDNDVWLSKTAVPILNIDDIPFPARDILNFNRYKRYFALGHPLLYTAHVISSRGCPFNCLFCNPVFGRGVRVRSPENILEEISLLQKDYNCNFIYFHDEVILGGTKKNVTNFCEYILSKNKRGFFWAGSTNSRILDNKILSLMKRAGCIRICLGVESGSQTILDEMRKKNDLKQLKDIVAHCDKIGIETNFSLLTNTFSETEDTLIETKNYLSYFNKFFFRSPFSINYIVPVHGTDIYNEAKKRGLINCDDLEYILSLDENSRYALRYNLTNIESKKFLKLVDGINRELAEDYFNKHRVQQLISKYTNLYHFRLKETVTSISVKNTLPLLEGLLWALCKGNEESVIGKVYKKIVYGEYGCNRIEAMP